MTTKSIIMDKLKIIKRAKELIENGSLYFMCYAFHKAIYENSGDLVNTQEWLSENIELFNHSIAIEKFGARNLPTWWHYNDYQPRLDYFDWLIEKYK